MKKLLIAAGFFVLSVNLNAGELVIIEDEGSQVSLRAKDSQLSVDGAVVPTAILIGRDPANEGQTITIGPVVGISSDTEALTLVEYEGKKYMAVVDSEFGIRYFRDLDSFNFYTDSNCENLFGVGNVITRTIVKADSGDGISYFLLSVDPEDRVIAGDNRYYVASDSGCLAAGVGFYYLHPYKKLPITEQELLKGAMRPYRVIYN